jgi:hypothetical protein
VASNLTERLPVERIRAEAERVHLGRLLLTLLIGVFYAIGWAAGKASLGVAWSLAAVKVGWTEARATERRPRGIAP